jgi:hypothetical protein
MNNRPAMKVCVKAKSEGATRVSLLAAWRKEDGKLSASLDKRVVRVVLLLDDGSKVDIQRGPDGKPTHYIDVFENDAAPVRSSAAKPERTVDDLLGGGSTSAKPFPADDIPF